MYDRRASRVTDCSKRALRELRAMLPKILRKKSTGRRWNSECIWAEETAEVNHKEANVFGEHKRNSFIYVQRLPFEMGCNVCRLRLHIFKRTKTAKPRGFSWLEGHDSLRFIQLCYLFFSFSFFSLK